MSRPTASSTTWCACWWAPWWTSDSVDARSPTSRRCWSGATTPRPARRHRRRASTSWRRPIPPRCMPTRRRSAHAGARARVARRPAPGHRRSWPASEASRRSSGAPPGAQAAAVQPARPQAAAQTAIDASRRTALVAAAERVSAAVVSINVTSQRDRTCAPARPGTSSSCPSGSRMVQGYGTGFVIRAERASSSPTSTWWPTPSGSS